MALISLLFSTSSIGIIIYFFIYTHKNRKNNSIFTDVNMGYRCYSCKGITSDKSKMDYIIADNPDFGENLCKCTECNRDDKLSLLIKSSIYKTYLPKLKRELYRRDSKLIPGLLITHFVFLTLYAVSMVFKVDFLTFTKHIYPPLLLIAWLLILYRTKLSYIKNPLN